VRYVTTETAGYNGDVAVLRPKLYEVGPVVLPAYEQTTVGVRSREIAALLSDPSARAELARALVLGTPPDEAARTGTSDVEAAATDQEPQAHSGQSPEQRARALALLTIEGL
jgi:hypothetical protein